MERDARGTVVVLPGEGSTVRASVIDDLRQTRTAVVDVDLAAGDPGPLSVRTCAAIGAARPVPPLVIVAFGDGASLVPAVALAQRAAHRAVAAYVLVDPASDPSAQDWPDAPVVVVAPEGGDALRRAGLRGWESCSATVPAVIAAQVRAQLG